MATRLITVYYALICSIIAQQNTCVSKDIQLRLSLCLLTFMMNNSCKRSQFHYILLLNKDVKRIKRKRSQNLANKICTVLTGGMFGYRQVTICSELEVSHDVRGEWKKLHS
jgi:hypothetical protein